MENQNIQFRLPTKEEFENLNKYFSRWNDEKKGLEIMTNNGDILFFPACGFYYGTSSFNVGSIGCYWSSTMDENDSDFAYYFYFDSNYKGTGYYNRSEKYPIRLVSDEFFEDGIEFDNIYWKTENEQGYFTFDETINKFVKV